MELINYSTGSMIAKEVKQAHRFWPRFKGLMFTNSMPAGRALHLAPCNSIHTFFMKYEIDVLYINKENEIVGIEECLKPGRLGSRFSGASSVIEFPAGAINHLTAAVGHTVAFVEDI
ncbi:DUF192 domain-containing protein [Planomicrobium sp. Y74]|uniref:DUF192 domain-containing protein n=1 Tax=Planomicrobium sp. Y74 TaxID=2478977 RepID=UPI000EF55628|nr:DUF192 domain-containing protein [Planomicrobium sp. Y74]RLQ84891.1 DUF192 domain-containing protein [Planomicrobium sp. Y74]